MRLVDFIGVLRRYQDKPSGYLIALIVVALALGVRELLDPHIKIPYVTLFPAMVVCSVVGGRLAGILAAVVGGLIAWYLWLPPRGTFSLEWPDSQLTIILYVVTSTILLLLTRGLNETLKELEKERDLSAELFRELQHRTANNLQNVSALLQQNREAIRRDPGKALEVWSNRWPGPFKVGAVPSAQRSKSPSRPGTESPWVLNRNMLFPLPRTFEQRHAGLETGSGNRPAEGTLLLVQQPMHHHAVQHHHDRIRDVRGPAFLDPGAHEMGGVSFDLDPLRIRCDTLHPAAPVEQFIIAGVAGAELEMSCAGVLEAARFCEVGREALKGTRAQPSQQRLPVGIVAIDRRRRGGCFRRHAADRHGLLAARLPQGVGGLQDPVRQLRIGGSRHRPYCFYVV
jgi:hypothetical protein